MESCTFHHHCRDGAEECRSWRRGLWQGDIMGRVTARPLRWMKLAWFPLQMVYNMAWRLGCRSPRACIMTFATSYVSLIYYTRTLSNTIEALLFVLLMNAVVSYWSLVNQRSTKSEGSRTQNADALTSSKPQTQSATTARKNKRGKTPKDEKNRKTGNTSKKTAENLDATKEPFDGGSSDVSETSKAAAEPISEAVVSLYCAVIGIVLVLGIFNRPTFPVFAAVPCVVFFLCDLHHFASLGHWLYICVFKMFKLSAWITVCSLLVILCDSFYYGSISSRDFDHLLENFLYLQTLARKLTLAPWNFVQYNLRQENLAEHGLHPAYQHFVINTPLLFGILAAFPVVTLFGEAKTFFTRNRDMRSVRTLFLVLTYFVPILLLSCFPHQEPRFLIPLLCPMALLYGHRLFDIHFRWPLSLFWVIFNIFCCGLFYGALHQGGLLPSIYEVRGRFLKDPNMNYHVIFSHTYMPPRHLFQIPNVASADQGIFQLDTLKFKHPKVEIHDLKGKPTDDVHLLVDRIIQDRNKFENFRIFVIAPSSFDREFCLPVNTVTTKIEYELVMSFVPQITTEDPPDFVNDVFFCKNPHRSMFCNWTCSIPFFDRLTFALSLNLYSVRNTIEESVPVPPPVFDSWARAHLISELSLCRPYMWVWFAVLFDLKPSWLKWLCLCVCDSENCVSRWVNLCAFCQHDDLWFYIDARKQDTLSLKTMFKTSCGPRISISFSDFFCTFVFREASRFCLENKCLTTQSSNFVPCVRQMATILTRLLSYFVCTYTK